MTGEQIGRLHVSSEMGFVVAAVEGEVDLSNAADIQAGLEEAVANTHHGVVMDLTETRYIDSSAITVLFRLLRQTRARNQQLRVVVPKGSPIRRVLELTELPGLLDLYETRAAAFEGAPDA